VPSERDPFRRRAGPDGREKEKHGFEPCRWRLLLFSSLDRVFTVKRYFTPLGSN